MGELTRAAWRLPSASQEEKALFFPTLGEIEAATNATVDPDTARSGVETDANRRTVVSAVLRELRPVSFKMKRQGVESKYSHYGVIAQELEEVLPDLVHINSQGMRSVRYTDLIAVLTLGVQSLDARRVFEAKREADRKRAAGLENEPTPLLLAS